MPNLCIASTGTQRLLHKTLHKTSLTYPTPLLLLTAAPNLPLVIEDTDSMLLLL